VLLWKKSFIGGNQDPPEVSNKKGYNSLNTNGLSPLSRGQAYPCGSSGTLETDMIKTLRITSIVAAVLAVIFLVFFVFPVVFGGSSDEQLEQSLDSPGVIEKFNKTVGNKAKTGQNEISPLVKQAGAFALYLNPPPAKTPRAATGRTADITRGPAVTPKFKVLGTSYYKGQPELSLALIDEPGKGLHWIRQSSKVGHLLIEQIKDGIVVFKDGKGTFELKAEQKPELSLLEGAPGASGRAGASSKTSASGRTSASSKTGASGQAAASARTTVSSRARGTAGTKSTLPASGRAVTGVAGARSGVQKSQRTAEEEAKRTEIAEMIKQIQRSFKSDKIGSVPSAKEKAEMVEKLMHELSELQSSKSSRLSDAEREHLNNLGKELKKVLEQSESTGQEENRDN